MEPEPNTLDLKMHDSPQDAPNYEEPEYRAANLQVCHVVGQGTKQGNPTVDFIFVDENGQKYIAMLTGGLVENLAAAVEGMKIRTAS